MGKLLVDPKFCLKEKLRHSKEPQSYFKYYIVLHLKYGAEVLIEAAKQFPAGILYSILQYFKLLPLILMVMAQKVYSCNLSQDFIYLIHKEKRAQSRRSIYNRQMYERAISCTPERAEKNPINVLDSSLLLKGNNTNDQTNKKMAPTDQS